MTNKEIMENFKKSKLFSIEKYYVGKSQTEDDFYVYRIEDANGCFYMETYDDELAAIVCDMLEKSPKYRKLVIDGRGL